MNVEKLPADRLAPAFVAVAGEPGNPAVRRSQRTDFQSDAALPLARQRGTRPRWSLVPTWAGCSSVEVCGPGFVNLAVDDRAHVGFGSVLGEDGKMLRSRAGRTVKLIDLLDEATTRAAELARQKNSDLDEATVAEVARAVGIGAVKYADLSTDRITTTSSTGSACWHSTATPPRPAVRARADTADLPPRSDRHTTGRHDHDPGAGRTRPGHRSARLGHGRRRRRTDAGVPPPRRLPVRGGHRVQPLLQTVPGPEARLDIRDTRLVLCDLTARILRHGLHLLGIATPERR